MRGMQLPDPQGDKPVKLTAPDGVLAVSIGTVTVEGPEADIDDPVLEHELRQLGWTEAKAPARKPKSED